MNYEKLSRGLRYYYDKQIIQKTSGARYRKHAEFSLKTAQLATAEPVEASVDGVALEAAAARATALGVLLPARRPKTPCAV